VDYYQITWEGNWATLPSSNCNATSKAKRCSGESTLDATGSMTYSFTGKCDVDLLNDHLIYRTHLGYSVAMSFASNNVGYEVEINGQRWSWTEVSPPNNCSYSVMYTTELSIVSTITITVTISDARSGRRALPGSLEKRDGPWFLDVNDFVY
jgi:hypothetical protein